MSLPPTERTSPRNIARAATGAGRLHDVVMATSKVVHDVPLADLDIAALRWARGLLGAAGRQTMLLDMPSAQQLAGDGTLAAAIRKAARPDGGNPDEGLRQLRRAIDKCLKGDRSDQVDAAMLEVRNLFAFASQLALQADVLSQGEPSTPGSWALSTTSSAS